MKTPAQCGRLAICRKFDDRTLVSRGQDDRRRTSPRPSCAIFSYRCNAVLKGVLAFVRLVVAFHDLNPFPKTCKRASRYVVLMIPASSLLREYRWFEGYGESYRKSALDFRVIAVVRDVTDRRRAEHAARLAVDPVSLTAGRVAVGRI